MDQKIRCQSCGMPLSEQFGNYGTNRDGARNPEYCVSCFKDGAFTMPALTLDEMIRMSIDNMTGDLKFPLEKARDLASSVIPNLKRWRRD